MTQEQAQLRAKKLVKFYYNLFIFVIVNVFLYVLDFSGNKQIDWAYWVTLGWGLGISIQAFGVYFGSGLEEKITQDLMKK